MVPVLFVAVAVTLVAAQHTRVDDFLPERIVVHTPDQYDPITDEIHAEAAVIYDVRGDRIIAGKNPAMPTSIASITKLAAALVALKKIDERDVTVVREEDLLVVQNTPIEAGNQWRTVDLIQYSLVTSSNRGMNAIARTVEEKTGVPLVDLMNAFARDHGLVQTHFVNVTGLDAHGTLAGSESSAHDLAKIASLILREEEALAAMTTLREKTFYTLDGARYEAKNTNVLLGELPYAVLLSKTGFTGIAGGSLIMAFDMQGSLLVFVVLNSSWEGRFDDMRKLILLYRDVLRDRSDV